MREALASYQPYYRVFIILTGGGSNAEFIVWIAKMWELFYSDHDDRSEFEKWLNDKCWGK